MQPANGLGNWRSETVSLCGHPRHRLGEVESRQLLRTWFVMRDVSVRAYLKLLQPERIPTRTSLACAAARARSSPLASCEPARGSRYRFSNGGRGGPQHRGSKDAPKEEARFPPGIYLPRVWRFAPSVSVRYLPLSTRCLPQLSNVSGVSHSYLSVASQQAVLKTYIRALLPPKGATRAVCFFKHDDTSRVTALPFVYLHSDICHCCFVNLLCFGILNYSEPSSGSRKAQHSEEQFDGKTMAKWISRFRSTLMSIWNNTTVRGFCRQNRAVVACMRIGIQERKKKKGYSLHIMQNCAQDA